jgi:hypothetical protein
MKIKTEKTEHRKIKPEPATRKVKPEPITPTGKRPRSAGSYGLDIRPYSTGPRTRAARQRASVLDDIDESNEKGKGVAGRAKDPVSLLPSAEVPEFIPEEPEPEPEPEPELETVEGILNAQDD